MPPSAPNTGSIACCREASCPIVSSRFSSRPMSKKKIAISPSFTQWRSESPSSRCQRWSQPSRHGELASASDNTVAPRRSAVLSSGLRPSARTACRCWPSGSGQHSRLAAGTASRHDCAMQARRVAGLLLVLVCGLAGCANVIQRIPFIGGVASGATESELRSGLAIWAVSFSTLVTAASDRIRNESKRSETRRNTLLWQLRMIPLSRQAAYRDDAQEAYVASLALASAQQHYLTEGDGRALFGEQQPIAQATAEKL